MRVHGLGSRPYLPIGLAFGLLALAQVVSLVRGDQPHQAPQLGAGAAPTTANKKAFGRWLGLAKRIDDAVTPISPNFQPAATTTHSVQPSTTSFLPQPTWQATADNLNVSELVSPTLRACSRLCIRREVSSLSASDWNRFVTAVAKLNEGQGNRGRTTPYEVLVQEHVDNAPTSHGVNAFFPWHRYYLIRFEQSLQEIDPGVCLPYWDWSRTSQSYWRHPVFTSSFLGSPRAGCISDGPFRGWNTRQSGGACVSREMRRERLASAQFVIGLMRASPRFAEFGSRYEAQAHAGPHVAVGGIMAQMTSPSDPLFWLHHATVDKHLADYWGPLRGGAYPNPGERLIPYGTPIGTLRNHQDWCYTYERSQLVPEDSPEAPSPIPESWLRMNFGDNSTRIHAIGNDTARVTEAVQTLIDKGMVPGAVTTRNLII